MEFIQQVINGLQLGSIYALVALGYTMVYGIIKLINFAHGEIIMVGAYIALTSVSFLVQMGLPIWLCAFVAVIFCAVLGILTERIAYRPLRNSPRLTSLITAIGISFLLQNAFMLIYSPTPKPFPKMVTAAPINVGSLQISMSALLTIVISIIIMLVLQIFIQKNRLGKAMRAVSEDYGAAQLMGININHTISLTFAIGSGLAAVAAIFYCMSYPLVEYTMGTMLGLKAFVAAVLGGIGVIPGAMIGGLVLGIVESLTKAYISTQLADAVTFGVLIVVLIFRPAGIMGKNTKEKV